MHWAKEAQTRLPILVQTKGFGKKKKKKKPHIWIFQLYKQTNKPRSKQRFGLTSFANKSFSFIKKIIIIMKPVLLEQRQKDVQVLSGKCFHSSHTKESKRTRNTFLELPFSFCYFSSLFFLKESKSIPSISGGLRTRSFIWPLCFYFTTSKLFHSGLRATRLLGYCTI